MANLSTPLVEVIGGKAAKALGLVLKLDRATVGDLVRYYPRRLVERGELTDLASLREGDDVTVLAEVLRSSVKQFGQRGKKGLDVRIEATVGDGNATLQLVFFGRRNQFRAIELQPGTRALFAGKVGVFRDKRQLVHPEYVLLGQLEGPIGDLDDRLVTDDFAGALIALYPANKDVRSWQIARAIRHALEMLDPVPDPVPMAILAKHGLLGLDAALRTIHTPQSMDEWYAARRRLTWDEALGVQLALAQRRAAAARSPGTARPRRGGGLAAAFEAKLPFTLTAGQVTIGETLAAELSRPHPMHRLLQGEVGSGKTVVALRAMLQVIDMGGQAALLAPTEVLAAQHARSIDAMLGDLAHAGQLGAVDGGTRVALLTGSLPASARRAALLDAASGAAGIVIGTHALIQDQVQFADLGLVVVDEQHRFGVEQRDALRGKAKQPPHVLVMTATPIPRTVAMTVFGDLETSTLVELPLGRSPIATSVVPSAELPAWLERSWQRIREEVADGHQAFIVCPRIGPGGSGAEAESGDEPAEDQFNRRPPLAVEDVFADLAAGPLAGLRLAMLHGRLPADDKDAIMRDFAAGEIDVLVATTVIEVGVDVPNATVMVVMDAERFGVSQLHQLRGRIGRGSAPGLCLLVTEYPPGSPSRERLDAVAATTDGFELARLDVEQRREGDILGASQSGRRSQLKLLSLLRDEDIIDAARQEATELVADDPELTGYPGLAALVASLVADEQAEFLEKG
jgi:ATP-dependent DNA helicase RecG